MNWEYYKQVIKEKGKLPENYYILGIDLGTTNSVISYWNMQSGRAEPIDISGGFGKIPMPSVVQFRPDNKEWIIGEEAYRSMKIYPENTIRSIKRKIGTDEKIIIDGKSYLPEDISAKIIKELVSFVYDLNPKAEIAALVVSVPYDFDDGAKKATMKACEIAGFKDKLICLIEEPKAAALAYNYRHNIEYGEKLMVFDFGGGTLDITVFHVIEKDDRHIKMKVISEGGEAYHGGDNIDESILCKCYELIYEKIGSSKDNISLENQAELILRSREAKERLSGVKSFRIPFTFCIPPFVSSLSREDFEELIADFIDKTTRLVQKTLREAYEGAIVSQDISKVLLEGGSSQMPWVKEMLKNIFNDEEKIYTSERPALDISLGASYYAAMKMGILTESEMETLVPKVEFEATVAHDIGLEIISGGKKEFFTMIRRGTPYSLAKKSHIFTLSGENDEDMTTFDLRILERIDKEDKHENCKLIGDVLVSNLPQRPMGKTRLRVTLLAKEEGGLIKGAVEDLGYTGEFEPSGYNEEFDPSRFLKTSVGGGK
ncbi:MAG: Hsp70 family protein [Defluviitaleaceae bacterium]|nr:Hsp70 family protein [Defluviitaleaceae bacterium]